MRRLALTVAAALAALGASAASAATDQHMHGAMDEAPAASLLVHFAAFTPPKVDVLAGDTLRWTNDSIRVHTITAVDGSFGSQRLVNGDMFDHRFDTLGNVAYYCTLHPFMRGEVDVHDVLLEAPDEPGAPGRAFAFHGRSTLPAGTGISIEADSGAGFQPAANSIVEDDGTFSTDVVPTTTANYRAVAGDESSQTVQLLVLDRKLAVSAGGTGRRVQVTARVAPASHGAPVVLQLRLPQHFGWWPVARAKLDHASMARFSLRLRHRYPARVVLTLRDGATALAVSRTLHVGPR
jgi:plastocyanin